MRVRPLAVADVTEQTLRAIRDLPVGSLVIVTRTPRKHINDTLLRTGAQGWLTSRTREPEDPTYMGGDALREWVADHVQQGDEFYVVEMNG